MIVASREEHRIFYWMAAETGVRAGEMAGPKLEDLNGERLSVGRSIWGGDEQDPKTNNGHRDLALSPQVIELLWKQIARQKGKGHEYLFATSVRTPWGMDSFRSRKLSKLLRSLNIAPAGFHAFRRFKFGLLDQLRLPLKTIQERAGQALTGVFTLDVYRGQPDWQHNLLHCPLDLRSSPVSGFEGARAAGH